MRRSLRPTLIVLLLLGGLLVATPRAARADEAADPSMDAPTILVASLVGDRESPGPGDADGRGFAYLILDPAAEELCYTLLIRDLPTPAVAAHIHRGADGVAGPVVLPLTTPDPRGLASACATGIDPALLRAIADAPGAFYVNVHTADYPDGALRGQLLPYDPLDIFGGDE